MRGTKHCRVKDGTGIRQMLRRITQRFQWRNISGLYSLFDESAFDWFNKTPAGPRREIIISERSIQPDDLDQLDDPNATFLLTVILCKGERRLFSVRWGLPPPWWDAEEGFNFDTISEALANEMLTARLPTGSPCLIPVSGYVESDSEDQWHYVTSSRARVITMAGIIYEWKDADKGSKICSCSVVTTTSNDNLRPISQKMPVLLPPDQFSSWLAAAAGSEVPKSAVQDNLATKRL